MQESRIPVGRFNLDLDAIPEEFDSHVITEVKEKNVEYLNEGSSTVFFAHKLCDKYAKEDGFPDVLDLSSYFSPDVAGAPKRLAKKGLSIFATEFDRLAGEINDSNDPLVEEKIPAILDEIDEENEKRLNALSADDLQKAQREIYERFDEKTLNFLKARGQKKVADKSQGKASHFKKLRQNLPDTESEKQPEDLNVVVEEKIKGLEVFNTDYESDGRCASESTAATHTRLAADAVHLDFMTKCFKSLIPRKQQNILRLFDGLELPASCDDDLIKMAQSNLPAIKGLYLDEKQTSASGPPTYQFTTGINPLEQSCWPLCPIRKVLDVCEKDGKVAVEDVLVVRLSLLWTVLFMTKRMSLFRAFTAVSDTYVRLAEVFLISPDVFTDECVRECVSRVMKRYIIPMSMDGLFSVKLTDPVASLDAFLPFYEDLLKHYEEDGMGDELFSRLLLIGAYMNSSLKDSLLMKCALWNPQRQLCRMIIVGCESEEPILKYMEASRDDDVEVLELDLFAQYTQLLAMYAKGIREELVTRQRNPLMFEIASSELGFFICRHEQRIKKFSKESAERLKEFDVLVDMFRRMLIGKLEL